MKDRARVRIECDRCRRRVDRLRTLDDRQHDLLMTEMQSIENAQRQNRRAKDVRILSAVEYFHLLHILYAVLRRNAETRAAAGGRENCFAREIREKTRKESLPANDANIRE